MSVFTPIKNKIPSSVHHSEYLRSEDQPDKADTKPAEPTTPETPETK